MAQRVAAFARLAVMLVCGVLSYVGVSTDADSVYTVVALIITVVAAIYSWWKNNNVTSAAQTAQTMLDAFKEVSTDTTYDVEDLFDTSDSEALDISNDVTEGMSELVSASEVAAMGAGDTTEDDS